MHSNERAIRAACLAVAISLAASVATASAFMLLRRQHNPMAAVTLDRVVSTPQPVPVPARPSLERDLLGEAVRIDRQRQGLEMLDRSGHNSSRPPAR